MQEDFYTKLFNIPPGVRPPDHYALLGLERFCGDIDRIDASTRDRLDRLDDYALHPEMETRDQISDMMNEMARARVDLVNPDRKGKYDRQLALRLGISLPGETKAAEPVVKAQPVPLEQGTDRAAEKRFKRLVAVQLKTFVLTSTEERILAAEGYAMGIENDEAVRLIRAVARRKPIMIIAACAAVFLIVAVSIYSYIDSSARRSVFDDRITEVRECIKKNDMAGAKEGLALVEEGYRGESAYVELEKELGRLNLLMEETVGEIKKCLRDENLKKTSILLAKARQGLPGDSRVVRLEKSVLTGYASLVRRLINREKFREAAGALSEMRREFPGNRETAKLGGELKEEGRKFVSKARDAYRRLFEEHNELKSSKSDKKFRSKLFGIILLAEKAGQHGRYTDAAKGYRQAEDFLTERVIGIAFAEAVSSAERLLEEGRLSEAMEKVDKVLGIRFDHSRGLALKKKIEARIADKKNIIQVKEFAQLLAEGKLTLALEKVNRILQSRPKDSLALALKKKIEARIVADEKKNLTADRRVTLVKNWETGDVKNLTLAAGAMVRSVAFSPDSKTLASGCGDNTVKLWDVSTGLKWRTLEGHNGRVSSIAFSPDGKILASGSFDHDVKLWDVSTGRELFTLNGHKSKVYSVAFSPNGKTLASGSTDKTVKLWEVSTGRELRTIKGHASSVAFVNFSPDGKTLTAGTVFQIVKSWDVSTGRELHTFNKDEAYASYIAYSPSNQTIASVNINNELKLWNVKTGRGLSIRKKHEALISSITFSPGGNTLAFGFSDKTVKLWDVSTRRVLRTLEGHKGGVYSVTFSPDGETIASGSQDKTIRLWNIRSTQSTDEARTVSLKDKSKDDNAAKARKKENEALLAPARKLLKEKKLKFALLQVEKVLKLHRNNESVLALKKEIENKILAERFSKLVKLSSPGEKDALVASIDFHPNGKILMSTGSTISFMNIKNRRKKDLDSRFHWAANQAVFSPDGKLIATGSHMSGTIVISKSTTIKKIRTIPVTARRISCLEFSPKGKFLAWAGSSTGVGVRNEGYVTLWSTKSGKAIKFKGHKGRVAAIDFSPDGTILASASDDNTVNLWDTKKAILLRTFIGKKYRFIRTVAFSPDGNKLAWGDFRGEISICDVKTGEIRRTFKASSTNVSAIAFLPDGKTLVSGSSDGTTSILNVETGDLLCSLMDGAIGDCDIAISSDGEVLARGDREGIWLWKIPQ